jgi:Na+/H+ antiporter NhaD/arsenite permease-like protein
VGKTILSIILTLAIIYIVPLLVYGIFSAVAGLKPPEDASPTQFLVSIFVSKVGTAIAFVLIFYFARDSLSGRWLLYAFIWGLMFVIGEAGQAIGPDYSWKEAVAGVISETIYFPLSAFVVDWLIGSK